MYLNGEARLDPRYIKRDRSNNGTYSAGSQYVPTSPSCTIAVFSGGAIHMIRDERKLKCRASDLI